MSSDHNYDIKSMTLDTVARLTPHLATNIKFRRDYDAQYLSVYDVYTLLNTCLASNMTSGRNYDVEYFNVDDFDTLRTQ